jgi:hypothetical protein
MGATGQANRIGLVEESVGDIDPDTGKLVNPNSVKRARRVDMLEVWHKKGSISTRAYNAAEKLRNAFEETMRSPGWSDNDRVQSSPKPDQMVAIKIDRISRFHAVNRLVGASDRALINPAVLRSGETLFVGYPNTRRHYRRGIADLNAALERLADKMG